MKSIYWLLLMGLLSFSATGQSVNDYKYVLVPHYYEWAKEVDKYQLNSLTTFLFKKYGFKAFQGLENLPKDVDRNRCNILTADVEQNATLFRTKLKVLLKDCNGDIVFMSQEGSSKQKQFKPAYHEALRKAFTSIEEIKYAYNEPTNSTISKSEPQQTSKAPEGLDEKPKYASELVKENPVIPIAKTEPKFDFTPESLRAANEFSGKGYFSGDQFIVEREIKGVQGIVKMIFEKE